MARKWFTYRPNFGEILVKKAKFVISQRFACQWASYEINYNFLITCNLDETLKTEGPLEKNILS